MIQHSKNRNLRTMRAESFSDVLDYIAANPRLWSSSTAEESGEHRRAWSGTNSLPEARKLAAHGWKDGADKLHSGMDKAAMLRPAAPVATSNYDVAGAFPDVGLYCSGDPACMLSYDPQDAATKPIYRFVIGIFVSAGVEASTITNRGAAILSYADKLESEGARVEILAAYLTRADNQQFAMSFPIKRADEPLDVERAAFIMAHPSMFRRICFAVLERNKELEPAFSTGYGSSSNEMPAAWAEANSAYFPCLSYGADGDYRTMQSAMATVQGIVSAVTKG